MTRRTGGAVWIAWERHRRTRSLVGRLGIPLEEYQSKLPRLLKHPYFVFRTVTCLLRRRPKLLFIQSPSLALNVLVAVLRPVLRYRLIVDAHNAGVYSCDPRTDRLGGLYRWLHRQAEITVVTNQSLAAIVSGNGGHPAVVIDPLPAIEAAANARPQGPPLITYICTFATDEPFNEVISAADGFPPDAKLMVTGNFERNRPLITAVVGPRVEFTGFLPESDFIDLLARSHVIVDLTTFDDCLVCGGYEAAAIGTPLVLSDSPANRATFFPGAVYCANEAPAIAAAVGEALTRQSELRPEMGILRARLQSLFESQLAELNASLG